jgi:hypothetical protein
MAIADFLPGIEAQVFVNGETATEYADEDEIQVEHASPEVAKYQASRTISKYIEAESDHPVSIKLSVDPPYSVNMDSKVGFYISVDGIPAWESTCSRPAVKKNGGHWDDEVLGVKEGKGRGCREKKFRFVAIKTSKLYMLLGGVSSS